MNDQNYAFAIVESCGKYGCQVHLIDTQETMDAVFSPAVLNKIKILPGQLVIVDFHSQPAQILWRWYPTAITSLGEDDMIVDDRGVRQLQVRRAPGWNTELKAGDEVWVGAVGTDQWEAIDRVAPDGALSQIERVQDLRYSNDR